MNALLTAPLAVLLSAGLLAGCGSNPPRGEPVATAPPAAAVTASAGDAGPKIGLDLAARDLNIKPGDDFFMYSNGHWYRGFEIPRDQSGYSAFEQLEDTADERVRKIIEEAGASHAAAGTPEQKIGDYYASFVDEAQIETNGLTPIAGDLQKIHEARSVTDIARLFGTPGFVSMFEVGFPPDFKNPSRYSILIAQAGLGLPDRDYYLKKDPELASIRLKYTGYITQVLQLGGAGDGRARARRVMALETRIAKAQWSIEERRDVGKTYNPRTKAELIAYAKGFPWQAFFDAAQVGNRESFVLSELSAIRDLAAIFEKTPIATLQDYLTFHELSDFAAYLPKRFDQAHFAFYGKVLRGEPEERERWRRGVEAVSDALGEQLGQVYVARYFPPESKAKMQTLVHNLLAALDDRINTLSWMGPETKHTAHEKIAAFVVKVGYPNRWKDYSGLEVRRGDLIGNVKRAALWDLQRQLARLDSPVDRDEWQMNVHQVNAYYNPLNNEIVFPAAILQPPFFDPEADPAANYGGIGAIIGHEIGHGFDDQGRKFGPDGSLKDWWTPQDAAAFEKRTRRLIDQYSRFEALPGLKVNGANTVGENIGDLGGLNMAYRAYQISLNGKPAPVLDSLTGDQRFFVAWGQAWRTKVRDGDLRNQVMTDVHSPAYFRVNGPLPNIDVWYAAFHVLPGDKLFLPPADRVEIW